MKSEKEKGKRERIPEPCKIPRCFVAISAVGRGEPAKKERRGRRGRKRKRRGSNDMRKMELWVVVYIYLCSCMFACVHVYSYNSYLTAYEHQSRQNQPTLPP